MSNGVRTGRVLSFIDSYYNDINLLKFYFFKWIKQISMRATDMTAHTNDWFNINLAEYLHGLVFILH